MVVAKANKRTMKNIWWAKNISFWIIVWGINLVGIPMPCRFLNILADNAGREGGYKKVGTVILH